MDRMKGVNRVFLATVLISCIAPYLGISALTDNYLILLLVSQLLLILPAAVYLILQKQSYWEAVRLNKLRISTIILLILLTILIMPLMTFVNALSMVFAENTTTAYMQELTGQNSMLISLIGVALVPAVLEESVYRGIFYNEYRKCRPAAAIFLSALLFALLHGNLNQFTYAFVMGIIFALVIEATNSIASTMIMHFIINANSILLMYAYPRLLWYLEGLYKNAGLTGDTELAAQLEAMFGDGFTIEALLEGSQQAINSMGVLDVVQAYGMSAVVCTVLAFIVYRAIAINNGRWKAVRDIFRKKQPESEEPHIRYSLDPEKPKKVRLGTPALYLGAAIMAAGMIAAELL